MANCWRFSLGGSSQLQLVDFQAVFDCFCNIVRLIIFKKGYSGLKISGYFGEKKMS